MNKIILNQNYCLVIISRRSTSSRLTPGSLWSWMPSKLARISFDASECLNLCTNLFMTKCSICSNTITLFFLSTAYPLLRTPVVSCIICPAFQVAALETCLSQFSLLSYFHWLYHICSAAFKIPPSMNKKTDSDLSSSFECCSSESYQMRNYFWQKPIHYFLSFVMKCLEGFIFFIDCPAWPQFSCFVQLFFQDPA